MSESKKILLTETDIPRAWFNIIPSMPEKPAPMLDPATKKPLTAEDLFPLFSEEASRQDKTEKEYVKGLYCIVLLDIQL